MNRMSLNIKRLQIYIFYYIYFNDDVSLIFEDAFKVFVAVLGLIVFHFLYFVLNYVFFRLLCEIGDRDSKMLSLILSFILPFESNFKMFRFTKVSLERNFIKKTPIPNHVRSFRTWGYHHYGQF